MKLCIQGCGREVLARGLCAIHYHHYRKGRIAAGTWIPRVDIVGPARRLQALIAIGHRKSDLAAEMGTLSQNITGILYMDRPRVNGETARKISEIYDRLSMTPGTSQRSRRWARREKWAPPLAWDDEEIDDPAAKPSVGIHRHVPFDERYRELRDLGYNDLQIVRKLGIQPESLMRQLMRYNLPWSPQLANAATRDKQTRVAS